MCPHHVGGAVVAGGDKIRMALRNMANKIAGKKLKLRVGFFENAKYPDGTPVAMVAFENEFGTLYIPARPAFREMIEKNKDLIAEKFNVLYEQTGFDAEKALELLGQYLKDELYESYNNWTEPPNASSTVKRKGFNKPLTDSGFMKDSADYEVTDD